MYLFLLLTFTIKQNCVESMECVLYIEPIQNKFVPYVHSIYTKQNINATLFFFLFFFLMSWTDRSEFFYYKLQTLYSQISLTNLSKSVSVHTFLCRDNPSKFTTPVALCCVITFRCPFIVPSLNVQHSSCLISTLLCLTFEIGWIISAKERCSLTDFDRFVKNVWE